MSEPTSSSDADLVADLNRLLRVDHDAAQAYAAAIAAMADEEQQISLIRYRGDHQRHIVELSRLIRRRGGEPIDLPRLPAGPFTWGVRAVVGLGGDREILSVIRANEEQVRDFYHRLALAEYPAEVAEVLRRHVQDEEKHYAWMEKVLDGERVEEAPNSWVPAARAGSERSLRVVGVE